MEEAPLMDEKSIGGRKKSSFTLLVWPLGHGPGPPSFRMGFPPCLSPLGGSRWVLRGGREEMLLWPSLIIRSVNCNYFCN